MTMVGQTRVVREGNGYRLFRNGKPYYVKGVGGETNPDKVALIGGNSIRTWGIDNAQQVLDDAQKHGLTVMLGLWLQTERHGFDYNNDEKVTRQFNHFKSVIDKFRNHPALLLWGIGNELDLQYTNPACWKAVQDIAAYVHHVDPDHPTSTVTAGLDSMEVQYIKKMAPDIDIYGINTYGDISGVMKNISRYGWDGPYMITEWGPNGYWEVPVTDWKVSLEQTSSEKKRVYYDRYINYIEKDSLRCIGSYAFFWGNKQEYTETWFGLFSRDNKPTEAMDALEMVFTGKNPVAPAPTITDISFTGFPGQKAVTLKAGEKYPASVSAGIGVSMDKVAPDTTGKLVYHWKVLKESTDKKSGGDAEAEAQMVAGLVRHANKNSIILRAPASPGAYRLFVTIEYNGKVAYANLPFLVKPRDEQEGQARFIEFRKTNMNSFKQ
jgi:hypothetical protein